MGAKESGQSFIAGVLAKLPDADRAAAQALFAKPEAEAAIALIGDGVLARSEFSRQMDDLKKKTEELDARQDTLSAWWEQNENALKDYLVIKPEYDKLKGAPNPNPNPNPNPTPAPAGLTQEQIAAELDARDRGFASAFSLGINLATQHLHMFNEPLNMTELLGDPNLGRPIKGDPNGRTYGLQDAYNTKHGTRVAEKQQAARQAEIEKEVQKRLAEERAKNPQPMPYPLRDAQPSPLDALTAERKPSDFTVESAVAEYDRLSQARQQAAGV